MTTLTFTVANLYDPKPNKPTGSIKTDTGNWIGYWPSDKHLFQEGMKYTAECGAREYQGTTYYTIKSPGKGGKWLLHPNKLHSKLLAPLKGYLKMR